MQVVEGADLLNGNLTEEQEILLDQLLPPRVWPKPQACYKEDSTEQIERVNALAGWGDPVFSDDEAFSDDGAMSGPDERPWEGWDESESGEGGSDTNLEASTDSESESDGDEPSPSEEDPEGPLRYATLLYCKQVWS